MTKSELLLPAGSLVKLKTAILYGADAVYAGTPDMCLRAQSKFSMEELQEGIEFVHQHGKKIYLTLNLFMHNRDVEKLPQFVETLRHLQPDGVLIADPGVFMYVKEHAPELNLFVSTQANICSAQAVKFWQAQGAKLCVLGREVTFAEMKEIREQCPDILLECFMHGAMCMSYSGRCLISNYLADRSANQGNCAHCCRWHYKLHLRLKDGNIKEVEITPENKNAFEFLLEEDFRPGDRVVLCPRHGCGFGERILLCCGEALFVSLPPGACRLTLCRCGRAVHLAVRMPPGANLCIRCCLETGRISWCWDFFRFFFNRCSGTRLLFGTSGSSGA